MNPYNFSLLCFGFCSLLLGILIRLKRQDEVGNKYLILSVFYAGWAVFISINLNNNVSESMGLFMGRLGNGIAIFIPVSWYHFIITYKRDVGKKHLFIKFLYLFSVIMAFFTFSPWFIPEVLPMVGFKYYSHAGPIFYFFTLVFFTLIPLSFLELFKKIKTSSNSERQSVKGLFWTSLIGYFGGSFTFLPIYKIPFPQYGLFLMPLYPFGLAYFMIKQRLFDVEELAQAAHRDKLTAIGVLAASINHEVKNPLFIIKGLAESWLERKKEGIFSNDAQVIEKAAEMSQRSIEQADRAMDIIKRLSLFAKAGIDSEIKFEPVRIPAVLEDILPLIRYELAAHSIVLTRDIPPDLPEVYADRRYLEEILFNLIVNAIQAIKEGEKHGEIRVSATTPSPILSLGERERVRGFNNVIITIQDNGPGIPADKLAHVFRPFYTTKAEGTGLGLYITQQLVDKIGGKIMVESKAGAGTTFIVSLTGRLK